MLSTFSASVRDGLSNLAASLGAGKDKASADAFLLRDLSRAEIEAMYRGDWLARKVVDIVPADMAREWRQWSGERTDVARMEAAERRLGLRRAVQRAMVLGRLYGGGAIVIGTAESDPAALARPLDLFDIRPGDLRFLHVVSRWQLGTPGLDRDPLSPWYGEASAYEVVAPGRGALVLHPSRVMRFLGNPWPDPSVAPTPWSDPVLQALYDAVHAVALTMAGATSLMHEAKVDVVTVPNLSEHLSSAETTNQLSARFGTAAAMKSINNLLLLGDGETWNRQRIDLAGLPEMVRTVLQVAVGVADIGFPSESVPIAGCPHHASRRRAASPRRYRFSFASFPPPTPGSAMATLVLRSAGAAIGTALGGPVGGFIGGALGAVGGGVVDGILANALASRRNRAPKKDEVAITHAEEGAPVRKLWGRMRLGGNVIWCTQFQAVQTSQKTTSSSGKGFGSSSTKVTSFELSFAVAFCEGGDDVTLGRVWADGNELDLSQFTYRFYTGAESQAADGWIESIEGTGNVPAYRGVCYLVFQLMPLDDFGNRMPQITAEIVRRPPIPDADDVTNTLRSVCLLPGAGEFVLGTQVYQSSDGFGSWFPENVHTPNGIADLYSALDQLDATLPNQSAVSLVVTWFGTDLRAGNCQIVPKVETSFKTVRPADWVVAGITRATAQVVSQIDPATLDPTGLSNAAPTTGTVPAFGGTPSDDTVLQAIATLQGRGLRVQFYPFVMMDLPATNGLPDPYGGAAQAAYPWRGRITCFPGPGQPGTVDKTSAAADQVNAFFAQYNPMVLHYAQLCVSAGGVDAFVIGSELVGLTQLRSGPGDAAYPAVQALKSLAAQVKAIVGPGCKVGYAADWTEYHSHRPADGTNDVIFNMDPLWSDPSIDFVGIDNYLPVADWRDGAPNVDSDPVSGPFTIYDKAYLQSNIEGGEDYAWYYASAADRVSQIRTPIVDTAKQKHWVFRQKDIRNWWQSQHYSRPGGVEETAPTAYVPQSKPIRFTEFGCPAVDKGPNQPNVFYDPKSSESSLPYFSIGSKDDPVQRAYLESMLSYWRDNAPVSSVYGGPMVSTADMYAWAWDARPFPDFPGRTAVWHDTPNYELGHWLTGRLSEVPLKWIITELCGAAGIATTDTSSLYSASTLVLGYATDALASPRDILAGLMDAHQFDARESQGVLQFFAKGDVRVTALAVDGLAVEGDADPGYSFTRAGDTDLPGALRLTFADPYRGYASAAVEGRKAIGNSQNVAELATAAALDPAYATDTATSLLQQLWAARETGTIKLPPSLLALDAGDAVTVSFDGVTLPFRIKSLGTTTYRTAELVGFDPSLLRIGSPPQPRSGPPKMGSFGPPLLEFIPLPPVTGAEPDLWAPRLAGFAVPWGGIDVYRSNGGGGFDYVTSVQKTSVMGQLTSPLYAGPLGRWDRGNTVSLRLYGSAQLLSLSEAQVLAGAGAIAVKSASGEWEVLQYQTAQLVAPGSYNLSVLLRGQLGTEGAMADPAPTGTRIVVLDAGTLTPLPMSVDQRGLVQVLRYGPSAFGPGDPSYTEVDLAFAATGLRPFAVAQIEASRALPAMDVTFTWLRRTRFAGDSWDPDPVPLNEETEAYDLEVTDGAGRVVRTVPGLSDATWFYPAALQTADFGAPQASYTINLYQLSALYGRGQVATATVFP